MHIYQIFYSDETRRRIDPGFAPLDNGANPRPDWREYWPIREFLLNGGASDEEGYYGFLSPKFGEKTGLPAGDALRFAEARRGAADVISYSPYFDQIAMFLNIYEQGEAHHPGLMAASQAFLDSAGIRVNLPGLVGHSGNTVFCNFFLARPRFWREWLRVNELLFALCEAGRGALAETLNRVTRHGGTDDCPLKVFVMERTASLLLMTGGFSCAPYDALKLPRASSPAARLGDELLVANALKMAFTATGAADYAAAFHATRQAAILKLSVAP